MRALRALLLHVDVLDGHIPDHWPPLPPLTWDATGTPHTDPDCPDRAPGDDRTNARLGAGVDATFCDACATPALAHRRQHPAAAELEAAGIVLGLLDVVEYWDRVALENAFGDQTAALLATNPHEPSAAQAETALHAVLDQSPICAFDFLSSVADAHVAADQLATRLPSLPAGARELVRTRTRVALARLAADYATVRRLLPDEDLVTLAVRVAAVRLRDTVTGPAGPAIDALVRNGVAGEDAWWFTTLAATDDWVGGLPRRENTPTLLELLWPGSTTLNRDRTRIAARVPGAFALARLANNLDSDLVVPCPPQVYDDPTVIDALTPSANLSYGVDTVWFLPVPRETFRLPTRTTLEVALELWQPPARGHRTRARARQLDAAQALAVAGAVVSDHTR